LSSKRAPCRVVVLKKDRSDLDAFEDGCAGGSGMAQKDVIEFGADLIIGGFIHLDSESNEGD
jgi:hypothetical protein